MTKFVALRPKTCNRKQKTTMKTNKAKGIKLCHKKKTLNLMIVNIVSKQLNFKIK